MQLLQGLLSPFETPRAAKVATRTERAFGDVQTETVEGREGAPEGEPFNGLAWLTQLGTPLREAGVRASGEDGSHAMADGVLWRDSVGL